MTDIQEESIMTGFVGEVESYLPDMKDFLRTLVNDTTDKNVVNELHRMTHTINGAAAMMRLHDLSNTAALMEKVVDDIVAGQQDWSRQLINVMSDTVERISVYCASLNNGEEGDDELYQKTRSAFEKIGSCSSTNTRETRDTDPQKELPLVADFTGDEMNDLVDDFFLQLSDEEEVIDLDDEMANLFDAAADVGVEMDLNISPLKDTLPKTSGIDPELQECFNEEAEEHLENIGRKLNMLSSSITNRTVISVQYRKKLHSIRRSIHTLKGAAAVIGIEPVADWGHSFEDFLDWLHDESDALSPKIVTAMLAGTDILEKIVDNPAVAVDGEISGVKDVFQALMDDSYEIADATDTSEFEKEQALVTDLTGDEENDLTDDFFLQLTAEEEAIDLDDEMADLFDKAADVGVEMDLNISPLKDTLPETSGIDPELQECFNEEAKEHLENIGRKLNMLSSSITGRTVISVQYRKKLHSIRRSIHTLKGAAAVIGIEPVADWGHSFEDFLDWLHDESDALSPKIVTAMLDGTDILEKIVDNPAVAVGSEISEVKDVFQVLMDDSCEITDATNTSEFEKAQPLVTDLTNDIVVETADKITKAVLSTDVTLYAESTKSAGIEKRRKQKKKKLLRVDAKVIDKVMGLSGDMAINLSGFESSLSFIQSTHTEFETILQRFKNIASSLETGYGLAAIPHLDSTAETGSSRVMEEFDFLEMDRYSELHILIRSMNEAVVDLTSIRDQNLEFHDSWRLNIEKQRRVLDDVHSTMKDMQMAPFSILSNRLYRTVRESARVTEKSVQLNIKGGDMAMDSHVWNILADPLMHTLRNSVDHGVEEKKERLRAGKQEQAIIRINCSRQGSRFVLRLSDDGKGLDYDAIRSRALALYSGTGVEQMDTHELTAIIFKQGFSIRTQVSTISGRGVGMDVVRNAVDRLNGSIDVLSEPGKGTELILSIPIAVAQLPALLVRFGQQQFAVPMRDITRVFRISDEEGKKDEFELDGNMVPLIRPKEILHLKNGARTDAGANINNDTPLALAVNVGDRRGVLVAEAIIGKKDVVFKSLGTHLKKVQCVAGATVMGDGTLVPILQTEDLFGMKKTSIRAQDNGRMETTSKEKSYRILIADDSISIRKVLTNFISSQGWHPVAAHDGIDAIEKVRENKPDLIILDLEMPRMNGFEVLQSLQSQSVYRDIPVLILTSRSAKKYRDKATRLDARGFISKPFKDNELTTLITSQIDQ